MKEISGAYTVERAAVMQRLSAAVVAGSEAAGRALS